MLTFDYGTKIIYFVIMVIHSGWLEELTHTLGSSVSDEELLAVLVNKIKWLGFDHFVYANTRDPQQINTFSTYSEQWQATYLANEYILLDPTVAHCLRSTVPLAWGGDILQMHSVEFFEESRCHGVQSGWSQSLAGAGGVTGLVGISRDGPAMSASELLHVTPYLMWLAQSCGDRLGVVGSGVAIPAPWLTPKETEVFKWLAVGKSSHQVAEIMRLSVDTVRGHIKNARYKLKAPNALAAVIKAVGWGLI